MTRAVLFLAALLALAASAFAQVSEAEYTKLFRKGIADLQAGRHDDGIAAFKRCLELLPEDATSAYNIACGYALKNELDPAFEWLEKAAALGFGNIDSDGTSNVDFTRKDPDLTVLRADPRFETVLAKMTAMRAERAAAAAKGEAYAATPATYFPEALAGAESVPLLVVLHDAGHTKDEIVAGRWKAIADELGFALLAPSAKHMTGAEPSAGMAWFEDPAAYLAKPWLEERSVNDAVSKLKKERKVDAARVVLAGEGQGGLVAQSVAVSAPILYKGVLVLDAPLVPELVSAKAADAGKKGQKLRLLLDSSGLGELPEGTKADDLAAQWRKSLEGWSLQGGVDLLGAPATKAEIAAAIRALVPDAASVEASAK